MAIEKLKISQDSIINPGPINELKFTKTRHELISDHRQNKKKQKTKKKTTKPIFEILNTTNASVLYTSCMWFLRDDGPERARICTR